MAYIRIKRIKKKSGNSYEYAYLVENKWRKRPGNGKPGARQKVKAFLGRIYKPSLVNEQDFFEYVKANDVDAYVKENSLAKITRDLISWEFFKHDIDKNCIFVDFENKIVRKYRNKVAVQMNEGFLCGYTLKNLVNFRFKEAEENAGMALAKAFVEAGVKVPEELFVRVFEKVS